MTPDGGLVSSTAQQNCLAVGCKRDSGVWKRKVVWKKTKAPAWIKGLQDFTIPEEEIIGKLGKEREKEREEGGGEREGERKREREILTYLLHFPAFFYVRKVWSGN